MSSYIAHKSQGKRLTQKHRKNTSRKDAHKRLSHQAENQFVTKQIALIDSDMATDFFLITTFNSNGLEQRKDQEQITNNQH